MSFLMMVMMIVMRWCSNNCTPDHTDHSGFINPDLTARCLQPEGRGIGADSGKAAGASITVSPRTN